MFGSKARKIDQLQRDLRQARNEAAQARQSEDRAKDAAQREYDARRHLEEIIEDLKGEINSGRLTPAEASKAQDELRRAMAVYSDPTR